jgi:putative SOS response-associated peptidase YedK
MYAFAGLWDGWKAPAGHWLQSFSIITVEASPEMRSIHGRMPAILSPRNYDEWLDRAEIERPPVHLLRPYAELGFQIHAANPRVGNVHNQDVDLLDSQ